MATTPTVNDLTPVEASRLRQLVREEITRLEKREERLEYEDREALHADAALWRETLSKLYLP